VELGGKCFDLEAAYKQCAVRSDHVKYAVFAFEAPSEPGGAYLYAAGALPFGATSAVVQFNRAARLLQQIFLHLFVIPILNYFDDFIIVAPRAFWPFMTRVIEGIADMLGWKWKPSSLETTFDASFDLLGVRLNLSGAPSGLIQMANTRKRVDELKGCIKGMLSREFIHNTEAASLAGRLQFAGAQCFGRTGAALLGPIRSASCVSGKVPIQGTLLDSLRAWIAFLEVSSPRELRLLVPELPVLIFTDGCRTDSLHGVGSIIYDREMELAEFFGMDLSTECSCILKKAAGTEHIIALLELLPVVLALLKWPGSFVKPGRRVIFFIDNESAKFGLIKGHSPAPASRPLIAEFWRRASALQLAPWFDRVASAANPADMPSRLDFAGTARLPGNPKLVVPPEVRGLLRILYSRG
jgi:hypothetical protein